MSASENQTIIIRNSQSGCASKIVGSLLTIFGFLACLTVIGAVIGIPMIIVGIIFFFAGKWAWYFLIGLVIYVIIASQFSNSKKPHQLQPPNTVAAPAAQTKSPMEPARVSDPSGSAPAESVPASPASFDCNKASGAAEHLVCANPQLASLDLTLAHDYRRLMAHAAQENKSAVRDEQRSWIKDRNDCGDEACLLNIYTSRLSAVGNQLGRINEAMRSNLKSVGNCEITTVDDLSNRFVGDPKSGSAVAFSDGVGVVSYDTIPAIVESKVGDRAKVCLVSIPTWCPADDQRGRVYGVTNLRTNAHWELPDSQHGCGAP